MKRLLVIWFNDVYSHLTDYIFLIIIPREDRLYTNCTKSNFWHCVKNDYWVLKKNKLISRHSFRANTLLHANRICYCSRLTEPKMMSAQQWKKKNLERRKLTLINAIACEWFRYEGNVSKRDKRKECLESTPPVRIRFTKLTPKVNDIQSNKPKREPREKLWEIVNPSL